MAVKSTERDECGVITNFHVAASHKFDFDAALKSEKAFKAITEGAAAFGDGEKWSDSANDDDLYCAPSRQLKPDDQVCESFML
mmetsp:Transcript_41259/g.104030  ORF Transcript_41259/g.104030 Transcript_41259/m.104030 type:complete len:83 (+) Transcript_41259:427-675(+)|eukprot:CAMPEP_0177667750 /NCGR_PEP_ID=MMETSP0447-20121125/22304_1 /TAXON_ID=0 /ORGANISM="Stygamoeba regulata, Strain BSH-02190019" /LENGTH=82 /DNA_ID=CAMNT_0019174031 /DNA_START=360 /DNA_END=608 /DNA_ORIENTATION=+